MTKHKRTRESKRALRHATLNLIYMMDLQEAPNGIVGMQEITGEVYSVLIYKDGGVAARAAIMAAKKLKKEEPKNKNQ